MHLKILHLELVKLIYYLLCKIEGGYDGLGFYADKFKLLYQIVSDENTAPTQALGNLMIIHPQP
jgi:hypothetical protein